MVAKTTTFPPLSQTVNNPAITIRGQPFNPQKPLAAPNGFPVQLPLGPVSGLPGVKALPGNMYAVPVAPPVKTAPEVDEVNGRALEAMRALSGFSPNFVWQYYHLVGVQAVPTNDETSEDFYLANIVVESSQPGIQLFRGFPPIDSKTLLLTNNRNQVNLLDHSVSPPGMTSGGGCQGCHGIAQTQQDPTSAFCSPASAAAGSRPTQSACRRRRPSSPGT